ncbi:zinc-ribbon domain-containing protein [Anatilimnocola sp. NA78]|uniref:zinc-ribbon domain-containing protein n=1 Tax=Anatilimnocola sp. NA78 TaxID=3415683 RepID=UPI003CE49396
MKTQTLIIVALIGVACLGLITVVGCAGLAFVGFRSMDSSISPAVDKLFVAIEQEQLGATYDSETSAEFRQAVTREQLIELGQKINTRLGSLKTKSMRQFHVRQLNADQFAEVSYHATFEHGSGTIDTRWKREGAEWKLVHLNVNSPEFAKDSATAKCPHCGEPHTASAKFCPKCGKSLAAKPADEKATAPTETTGSKSND